MAARKSSKAAQASPAPISPVLGLGGKSYTLKFTYRGLAEARRLLREQGVRVNLLQSLNIEDMDADTLPALLFGALREHHAEISYTQAERMVSIKTYGAVTMALCGAYWEAMQSSETGPSEGNPPAQA